MAWPGEGASAAEMIDRRIEAETRRAVSVLGRECVMERGEEKEGGQVFRRTDG
jgi:hypothetical protein